MSGASSWPPADPERLADAVAGLADGVAEPEVRAQLHALAGLIRNLVTPRDEARTSLSRELAEALASRNEARSLEAARVLGRFDRDRVRPVDWRAASGG